MINPQVKKPIVAKKKKIKTPSTAKSIVDPRDAVRKEQKDSTSAAALQARIAKLEKQLAAKPKMPIPSAMMNKGGLTKEQIKYIDDTLLANKDKLFIDRMRKPENYPMIDDGPLDSKTVMGKQRRQVATHKISNADNLVFPTIIAEKDAMGKPYLVDLEKKYKVREKPENSEERTKALNLMIDELEKKGQVIKVESPEKAALIAKNYKQSSVGRKLEQGFDEGGLLQEGGTVDPVSGNDVPIGSTKKEVRDDIPAQLSEGEFVFPADVVRFIGLNNLMKLRQEAKEGLGKMDRMGQMGNSEEATEDDTGEFDSDIDSIIKEVETEMASQGLPKKSIETTSETEEALPVKKKSIMEIN